MTLFPRDPRVSSQKLYVAVFYNEFAQLLFLFSLKKYMLMVCTMNLAPVLGLLFVKRLYVDGFYNEFCTFARPIFY